MTHGNGMLKDIAFELYAFAASLLLLRMPNLERLELSRHMYTEIPFFDRMPAQWNSLLPLALPKLRRVDLLHENLVEYSEMVQWIEKHISGVKFWPYTLQMVRVS